MNFCVIFAVSINNMFSKINFSRSYTGASLEIGENTFFKSNLRNED